MTVPYRPITRVENVVKAMGLQISYAYDDIVFVDHTAFLLRMGDAGKDVVIHFNVESVAADRRGITQKAIAAGLIEGLSITPGELFTIRQKEKEEIELQFVKE